MRFFWSVSCVVWSWVAKGRMFRGRGNGMWEGFGNIRVGSFF